MPSLSPLKITTLASTIYPPDFSGTQPYTTQTARTKLAIAEGLINCFAFGTNLAYNNQSRAYQFSVFPGMHAQDTSYTFFSGGVTDGLGIPVEVSTAETMQRWFVGFAMLETDRGSAAAEVPVYGAQANVVNVTGAGGFARVRDPAANARCRFWLEGVTA